MAESEILLAPDLDRIERGDNIATADAIQVLTAKLNQLESELTLAKAKGLGANLPPAIFPLSASTAAALGTFDVISPRTGKTSVRLGALGQIQPARGSYVDTEGGLIIGGESAHGGSFFEHFYGHWMISAGHENRGAADDADILSICHTQGGTDAASTTDHVLMIRHDNALAPFEEYALVPPRTPSGFGAARPSVSVGSLAHVDYSFERIVGKDIWARSGFRDNRIDAGVTPQGDWQTMPYSAGNFVSASTWGVDDADEVVTFTLVGHTVIINVYITGTDVGAAPGNILRMASPTPSGGSQLTAAQNHRGCYTYVDAGGTPATGFWAWDSGNAYIDFFKIDTSNWTNTTADNTNILGQVIARVN